MVHTCFFQCILSELYVENSRDAGVVVETEYTQPLVQLITQLVRSYYQTCVQKHTLVTEYIFYSQVKLQLSFPSNQTCTVVGEMV